MDEDEDEVSASQVVVQRIFDKDGSLINKTLPDTEIKTPGKRPIPYDVFQIPSGFFFFNMFFVVADKSERIIEPASGHLVYFYTFKDGSKEKNFLNYHQTKNVTLQS